MAITEESPQETDFSTGYLTAKKTQSAGVIKPNENELPVQKPEKPEPHSRVRTLLEDLVYKVYKLRCFKMK